MSAGSNVKDAVKALQWQLVSPSHKPGDLTNAWCLSLLMTHQQDEVCTHKTHTHAYEQAHKLSNKQAGKQPQLCQTRPTNALLCHNWCQFSNAGLDTKTWMDRVKLDGDVLADLTCYSRINSTRQNMKHQQTKLLAINNNVEY